MSKQCRRTDRAVNEEGLQRYNSPTLINNPNFPYGSPYSPKSATNPNTRTPPRVIYGDTTNRK